MTDVVSFAGPDGASLQVEVDDDAPGIELISRDDDGVLRAGQRLEDALAQARPAIRSVIDTVRRLGPDEYEVEFGVKFNAESGVVIAKTSIEGHFQVRVHWSRNSGSASAPPEPSTD